VVDSPCSDNAHEGGKDFERLIADLFRCVLHCGTSNFRSLFDKIGPDPARGLSFSLVESAAVKDVKLKAFPRAKRYDYVECDSDVTEKLIPPCIGIPVERNNMLLDVVAMVPRPSNMKPLCVAFQAKEWVKVKGISEAVATWRKRDPQTVQCESQQTRQEMKRFFEQNDMLWVMVMVNSPAEKFELALEKNEALLTLERAKRWCPSLTFAESAIAVSAFVFRNPTEDAASPNKSCIEQ
jgi:hypothetical protein